MGMVRAGEVYNVDGIKVRIVEVAPYYTYRKQRCFLIGYRIVDGNYTSPIAHFWMRETEDIRKKIREVVDFYKDIKKSMPLP